METLVQNYSTLEALAGYLMHTCSGDGLEFWLDVEFFKRLQDSQEVLKAAKHIYTTYIMPTAQKELVLDPLLKHSLVRRMSKREPECDINMFNSAQDVVGAVLAARCNASTSSSSSSTSSSPSPSAPSSSSSSPTPSSSSQDSTSTSTESYAILSASTSSIPVPKQDQKSSRFTLSRQNTFPRQISNKLQKYNQTITKEKSLISFDVHL